MLARIATAMRRPEADHALTPAHLAPLAFCSLSSQQTQATHSPSTTWRSLVETSLPTSISSRCARHGWHSTAAILWTDGCCCCQHTVTIRCADKRTAPRLALHHRQSDGDLLDSHQVHARVQTSQNTSQLSLDAFTAWLQSYGMDMPGRAAYAFQRLDLNNDSVVDVGEYVQSQMTAVTDFVCHTASDAAVVETAFPGCPCNPVPGAAVLACPSGEAISSQQQSVHAFCRLRNTDRNTDRMKSTLHPALAPATFLCTPHYSARLCCFLVWSHVPLHARRCVLTKCQHVCRVHLLTQGSCIHSH